MSDWKHYLDQTHGSFIHPATYAADEPLSASRLLRPGARELILSNVVAARRFLEQLGGGELEISSQQGLVQLLLDIHRQVHMGPLPKSPWAALDAQLTSTLSSLAANVGTYMEAEGARFELDDDELSHAYGYGRGVGCIQYGLPIARQVALRAFIEAFCLRHATSANSDDLVGSWCLVISDPQVPEFAEVFPGTYGPASHARITKVPQRNIWHLEFLDFPPIKPWYVLEGAAYRAAAPVVAEVLAANVVAVGELID